MNNKLAYRGAPISVYERATLANIEGDDNDGLLAILSFDSRIPIVRWRYSKRLMYVFFHVLASPQHSIHFLS